MRGHTHRSCTKYTNFSSSKTSCRAMHPGCLTLRMISISVMSCAYMCMCVYICVCVCVYASRMFDLAHDLYFRHEVRVCICVCVRVCVRMRLGCLTWPTMSISVMNCARMCWIVSRKRTMHACNTCMYVCIHTHVYACMCVYTYVHMYLTVL